MLENGEAYSVHTTSNQPVEAFELGKVDCDPN